MRLQNRLFVSWRSPTGMDCKLVGPETLCFCTHRYKQHKTDFETIPQQRPISLPCRVTGCPCRAYLYVPLNGTQPIRCRCKHFADQHSPAPGFACNACAKCSGFHSCFTCACGQPAYAHDTVVETKQERLAQGKPVGRDVPYAAAGGLTGFSSLAEGYMRLDDSGLGAPSVEFLDSPVTSTDHPFLRAFQAPSSSSPETLTDGTSSQVSSLRRPEEDDMAFFERRYQERNINRNKDIMKIGCSLSEVCPHSNSVFGNLDPKKGRTFLGSLIFEKEIKIRIKATNQDGTVIAQAEYGSVDIGEEVAKKGFAEKCKLTSSTNISEEKKLDPGQLVLRNLKSPIPSWGHRSKQSPFSKPKGRLSGKLTLDLKNENDARNHVTFPKESLAVGDFNLGSNVSLAKIKQDQKLIEENEKLKTEKEVLLESYKALELKVEQTAQELQHEKAVTMDLTKHVESTLKTCVGTRMKDLAAKVETLKEIRRMNIAVRFGNDLSDAIQVLDEGCFTTPTSLTHLEIIWAEYNLAQENIRTCENVNEGNILIAQRNEVHQKLCMAVEVFILEIDELPLTKRLEKLQNLSTSLEAVYGQAKEGTYSEEIFRIFDAWKCSKREEFTNVRSETEASLQHLITWFQTTLKVFDLSVEEALASENTIGSIDEILEKTESSVCKELEISLVEQGDTDKEIILSTYSQVLQKIHSEERLIATVHSKYKDSIEFKKQTMECLNKSPSVDQLLSIKKTLKGLKARLRWKLVEKSNLEESDDHDGSEIEKIKQEITQLRNSVFQEIYREREEYNSGGLLTMSLERDLLDAEPMKELSSKRPLVCSEINGQIILLKETLKVMKGVAQGLHTLHKADIIHGSLHQNNVFALNREQGIVGDFDFTKSVVKYYGFAYTF
ncbi:Serine/threonine-protein kinase 31 [Tupaia chinensis]|uniref:Protein FAM221A n=1 Tax=Tupaia chinensis TaxID=246437 RepID=L9KY03_TUPCH|nr:Serine/threonine-protein kinase 31 [Tupaia chinensis]